MNRQIKTILITGINGFIGSSLANRLASEYEIIGLGNNINNLKRNLQFPFKVYSSINTSLDDIFKEHKIDVIIHTATVYQKIDNSFEQLIHTNILLPIKLLELSHQKNVKLFLNTDTFFNQPNPKYSYLSYYTLSKKHFLDWLNEITGPCKLVNVKLFHPFGPNDRASKFVPTVLSTLISNQKSLDLTEGKQLRDFIYVDDVVSAYTLLLREFEKKSILFPEYQVGTGNSTAIRNFVLLAKELCNSNTLLNFGSLEYRNNEIMDSVANIDLLKEIGWTPKYSLEEGLRKTIEYIKLTK